MHEEPENLIAVFMRSMQLASNTHAEFYLARVNASTDN